MYITHSNGSAKCTIYSISNCKYCIYSVYIQDIYYIVYIGQHQGMPYIASVQCMQPSMYRSYMGWLRSAGSIKLQVIFFRMQSFLQGSFAKETYNFIDPTNQNHPIAVYSIYSDECMKCSMYGVVCIVSISHTDTWNMQQCIVQMYTTYSNIEHIQ